MTSSGTTNFNPSASNLTLAAFARIGIRRTEITAQHMADADSEGNFAQVLISNSQPNLWKSEVYPITLVAGTAAYSLPARMIAIQDVYITTTNGGTSQDRLVFPLSLFQYDAQPNKTRQAPPTAYLIQKLISPTITFWQVPDSASTYTANVRMLSQGQDVSQASGATLDMPYKFLDVYVAGLAHRLSRIYAPDKEQIRKQDYMDAWAAAANTDTQDNVGMTVSVDTSGYWRR